MVKKIFTFSFLIILFFCFGLFSWTNASYLDGNLTSGIESGIGSMDGVVKQAPTASPAAGTYHSNQSVSLSADGSTAICYTTDDTTPACDGSSACSGTGSVYSSAISVTLTDTIQSIACYADGSSGPVSTDTYTLTCTTASVSHGTVGAYPGCAITCDSGYTLSGSTCIASGGGGGGGGGGGPAQETTQQTSVTTSDGTQTTAETSSANGVASTNATINMVESPTDDQTITLDSSAVASVKQVEVGLSSSVMQELVADYGADTDIQVNISSQPVSSEQKSTSALSSGTFLVGYDVFTVEILANNAAITSFENPITISFDVSGISNPENLSVAWFDTAQNKWVDLGGTLVDGILSITVDHLTVFTIITTSKAAVSSIPGVPATDESGKVTLEQMTIDAEIVVSGDVNQVTAEMGVARDTETEATYNETIVEKIVAGAGITAAVRNTINNFVAYGTKSTKVLGAGERAGVVNSFQSAFNKLPTTTADWNDVMKIANGRWPDQRSEQAESDATATFKKIYLRDPDRTYPHDDAAVTVMAYGLRPADRNLNSERAAIGIFKDIYGYNPTSATDWDAVRAIAYSGAIR